VPTVACPACAEDEDLTGERHDDTIVLTCGRCDTTCGRSAADPPVGAADQWAT
jgi:hypothetical protein